MNKITLNIEVELARNLLREGKLFHFQGLYEKAENNYRSTLSRFEQIHQDRCDGQYKVEECPFCSVDIATILHNQAKLADEMGNYGEAEKLYKRAILVRESVYDREIKKLVKIDVSLVRDLVSIYYHLASFYHHRWQEYDLASRYYNQAVDLSGMQLGNNTPETLQITAAQALLRLDQAIQQQETKQLIGQLKKNTEKKHSNALDACGAVLIPYSIAQTWLANNLAVIYQSNGERDLARQSYEQAIHFYQESKWTDNFSYAVLLTNYAKFLQMEGRSRTTSHIYYRKAESIYLEARSKTSYPSFYQVADFLYDYSRFLQTKESILLKLNKALDIYCSLKPEWGHEKIFQMLDAYWECCRDDSQMLEDCYERLIKAYKKALDPPQDKNHAEVIARVDGGQHEKALDPPQDKNVGAHLQLARVQHHYAYWLDTQKHDFGNAQIRYQKALSIYQEYQHKIDIEHIYQIIYTLHDELKVLKRCHILLIKEIGISPNSERKKYGDFIEQIRHAYDEIIKMYEYIPHEYHWLQVDFTNAGKRFVEEVDIDTRKDLKGKKIQVGEGMPDSIQRADHQGLTFLW